MKIEVSLGEAIDKYSILELKKKKITDVNKLIEIKKEIDVLCDCFHYKNSQIFYYKLLMYVNEKIWDMTDVIKSINVDNPQFSSLSNEIFDFNQKRFRIKNWFNLITKSTIKEQKSYASKHCKIIVNGEQTFYDKIPELNYLSLEYDVITFESQCSSTIKNIFSCPAFIYDQNICLTEPIQLCLENFNIINKEVYELPPITYIIGGMFGDFVQSLSVINENFYETGRKGILFISNKGDKFRYGLENTYNDTYETIIKQSYIKDYKIYNNESYDIDLTLWRKNPSLYKVNWYHIYHDTYNVEWGKHVWLDSAYDEKWKNKILINTTSYRWCDNINFMLLNKMYPSNMIFISSDINEYNFFIKKTNLNIPFYEIKSFSELCTAIKSCNLFAGSLSAPLAIANAFGKDRIIGMSPNKEENILNSNLEIIWKNIRYII